MAMKNWLLRIWRIGAIVALVAMCLPLMAPVMAQTSGDGAQNEPFQRVWARTDQPVQDGNANRSWIWGEPSRTGWFYEQYAESPDGRRLVQYFDKSRMEITDPAGDPESIWYVTNGLLVVELISGRVQVGNSEFIDRSAAEVNVAGDPDDESSPTYATFASVIDAAPLPFDNPIIQRLDREGNVTSDESLAARGVQIAMIDDVTGHAIPEPFWEFMTSSGGVYESGELVDGLLFHDPNFGTGRPISEAYWANVRVGGTSQEVLMQCFERRCLTYTPGNEPGWQVEAVNVGQHYQTWRYADTAPEPLGGSIAYVVDDGEGSSLWTANPDRTGATMIVESGAPITEIEWLPDGSAVAFLRQDTPSSESLNIVAVIGGAPQQLSATSGDETYEQISVSPASDWIVVERRVPNPEPIINAPFLDHLGGVLLVSVDGGHVVEPLEAEVGRNFVPVWSPDGSLLALNHSRWWGRPAGGPGATNNFSGDIIVMNADGTNIVAITDDRGAIDNGHVDWSPDSTMLAYRSEYTPSYAINNDSDIFVAHVDGSETVNLTDDLGGRNDGPAWRPDGQGVTFRHDVLVGEPIYGYAGDTLYTVDVAMLALSELATESGLDGLAFPEWAQQGDLLIVGHDFGESVALIDGNAWWFIGDADGQGRAWTPDGDHILIVIGDSPFAADPIIQETWVFGRDGIPVARYDGNYVSGDGLDWLN